MNEKVTYDKRLAGQIIFILMKAGVSGPEIDECIFWAFGLDAWYVPISPTWIERWNKLHPTYFRVKKNDKFVDLIYVVGKAFLKQKYGELTPPGMGGTN